MNPVVVRLTSALADRYLVERELGAGGMATVYLAHDLKHDRDVAIKVLHPDLGAALGGDRFLSEIRTTARLQHPHILPLLDSGNADGLLFYVMPLVTGETLRARLERERQLPVDDVVRIAREVADALAYAHGLGVIHRDIKPENILLQNGHALVADFGIALAVQSAGGQRMTQTGLSLGTPQYMSPEQAMGERVIDARSDVYALGAVTYEMLIGEPPFTGPSVQAIVARIMAEEPRGLVSQRKAIPDQVEAAVLRALEKLPADRFAGAAEFATALDARVPTSMRTAGVRVSATRSRAPLVALGALALLSTAAAAWGWSRPAMAPEVVRYRIEVDSIPAFRDPAGEVAVSPDGNIIVRMGGNSGALLIRRRDELSFKPIPGTEDAYGPFFSHDGSQIGYFSDNSLKAVPVAGGPSVLLRDSIGGPAGVLWAHDGLLYFGDLGRGVIARTEPRPGSPSADVARSDSAAGELGLFYPDLLPDGNSLLCMVMFRDGRRMIAIADISTGKHTLLVDGIRARYAANGDLIYSTSDGKLWAAPFDVKSKSLSGTAVQIGDRLPNNNIGPMDFALSASGTLVYTESDVSTRRQLTWVTRAGARERFGTEWLAEFSSPALSPDGRRVAVTVREGQGVNIWLADANGGRPSKLTLSNRNNLEPAWAPDGKWVSYLSGSASGNTGDVWRQPADGSGRAERILHEERPFAEQVWSPDGSLLARTTTATPGLGDILVARSPADTVPTPLVAGNQSEYSPIVSPDGRWLAFTGTETGRLEVYVASFANPADKRVISVAGGFTPRWSHSGDELFYLDLQSRMVAARVVRTPAFAVQDTRVLFDASDYFIGSQSRRSFDVSADDQRFLMVQSADGKRSGTMVVVEHWFAERKAARR